MAKMKLWKADDHFPGTSYWLAGTSKEEVRRQGEKDGYDFINIREATPAEFQAFARKNKSSAKDWFGGKERDPEGASAVVRTTRRRGVKMAKKSSSCKAKRSAAWKRAMAKAYHPKSDTPAAHRAALSAVHKAYRSPDCPPKKRAKRKAKRRRNPTVVVVEKVRRENPRRHVRRARRK